jgi:hypothetical protein
MENVKHTALPAWSWASVVALAAACANDDARPHVYQSSPPPRTAPAAVVSAGAGATAEPPIGSSGPSARVVSVRLVATGEPATLERLTESVDVVTIVSRGAGSSAAGPARLELHITGSLDTTLVTRMPGPVPRVIAHSFRLSSSDGSVGLPTGRYRLQVRLVGPTGRQVASAPLAVGVGRP